MRSIHGLYGITLDNDPLVLENSHAALKGGCQILQYRDKILAGPEKLRIAKALKKLCEQYAALLIINDDVELAIKSQADGVHVGKKDTALQQAREQMPCGIIGVSCYNELQRAKQAVENGADYVAFGRYFPSKTKPSAVQATPELLTQAKAQLTVPVVAIGGITVNNAESLLKAGADSVAVIHGLFAQENIEFTARQFTELFQISGSTV